VVQAIEVKQSLRCM